MRSAVTAPDWTDASGTRSGDIEGDAGVACLRISVHSAKGISEHEAVTTELIAWGVLPLMMPVHAQRTKVSMASHDELYLNAGKFQLPLFSSAKTLRKDLVSSFAGRSPNDPTSASSLKLFCKSKRVLPLEGASAFVRIVDLQLPPELQPTRKSPEDLSQVSIGATKRSYTAPLDKKRQKETFQSTRPKKEGEKEFDLRVATILDRAVDVLQTQQDNDAALHANATAQKQGGTRRKKKR